MTKSKLEDRLEDRSVKSTDYAINKYQANFDNVKGKSVGIKLENFGSKGVKLYQYKKSKRKYFQQQFWFNGKSDHWPVGEFRFGIFGIKDCKTKVVNIMDTHSIQICCAIPNDKDGIFFFNSKNNLSNSRFLSFALKVVVVRHKIIIVRIFFIKNVNKKIILSLYRFSKIAFFRVLPMIIVPWSFGCMPSLKLNSGF